MDISKSFKSFCTEIELDNLDDMTATAGEIAKKLNKHYYESDKDESSHLYIVGSVGRKTAVKNNSDLDIIFDLPESVYRKYDSYESNGQSSLLQEVKEVLKERYPNTKMRGDGQVVVIEFNKYTIELVPGFKQKDDRFKYPDTHDGGSWKYTDPLSEQEECNNCNVKSGGIYFDFCHIIRCWKNNIGFEFGGLLIDTLVYNHFSNENNYSDYSYDNYLDILKNIFEYLKKQNKNQSYWYAVGSNQQVHNSGDGTFVGEASEAYSKLDTAIRKSEGVSDVLYELLGSNLFESTSLVLKEYHYTTYRNTEQHILKMFPVDIRYSLQIDCKISQDGWRDHYLLAFLRDGGLLRHNKKLDFFIKRTNCPPPYSIYWKVRNVGEEAQRRDDIRGQIIKTDNPHHKENTRFWGPHYVECYLVKNGICVARCRIDVPIGRC